MNTQVLEQLARKAMRGDNVAGAAKKMAEKGALSALEHQSLKSLSFQIAANVKAGAGAGTQAMVLPNLTWL